MATVLEPQLQHQSFQYYSELISFRIDWFDLLAVQGTLKSLHHHSSKVSILRHFLGFYYCGAPALWWSLTAIPGLQRRPPLNLLTLVPLSAVCASVSGISSGPCYGILPSGEVSYLMQSLQDTYSPWPLHSFLGRLPGQLRCFYFAWWWPALSPVLCEPPQWKLLTPCSSCLGVKFCMYVCACVQSLQSCLSLQPYRL